MKVGQLKKGLFRFVVTDEKRREATKGKVYESDEYGVIRMEDDTEFHTHGDKSTFYDQMDLFFGCNSYIEIPDEKRIDVVVKNVNSLKYGDFVTYGDEVCVFLGFCRNEAMLQHRLVETTIFTAPVHWLRKVDECEKI